MLLRSIMIIGVFSLMSIHYCVAENEPGIASGFVNTHEAEWTLMGVQEDVEIYFSSFEFDGQNYFKFKLINTGNQTGKFIVRLLELEELVIFSDDGAEGVYVELTPGAGQEFGLTTLVDLYENGKKRMFSLTLEKK